MYTQCEHCKAIFRVNMREVTVAKGKLRCGECKQVFNATDSLSTTIPVSYEELEDVNDFDDDPIESHQAHSQQTPNQFTVIKSIVKEKKQKAFTMNWKFILVLILLTLLFFQFFYNNKHFFLGTTLHQPEKIQMLNHNVFAHPNESGTLLISALIENTADQEQPYPVLELRLNDSQSKLIALRRFFPDEYLEKHTKQSLIPSKSPINIRLKIKDPGKNATHFQFEFL